MKKEEIIETILTKKNELTNAKYVVMNFNNYNKLSSNVQYLINDPIPEFAKDIIIGMKYFAGLEFVIADIPNDIIIVGE